MASISTNRRVLKFSFTERVGLFLVYLFSFLFTINTGILLLQAQSKETDIIAKKYDTSNVEFDRFSPNQKGMETLKETTNLVRPNQEIEKRDLLTPSVKLKGFQVENTQTVKKNWEKAFQARDECIQYLGETDKRSSTSLTSTHKFWRIGKLQSRNQSIQIVLATQLSTDRLPHLLKLAERWRGPVSAAIYLCREDEMRDLREWIDRLDEDIRTELTIHLAIGNENYYPINLMRNLAIEPMQNHPDINGYVFYCDADAIPSSSAAFLAESLSKIIKKNLVEEENTIFIVPAFEWLEDDQQKAIDAKSELRRLFNAGKVQIMHKGRPSYSAAFSPAKWLDDSTEGNFGFLEYQLMFEPYFVIKLSALEFVMFDERFVGRGFNKQSFHFEMWAKGFDYFVLPDVFLVDFKFEETENEVTKKQESFELNKQRWQNIRAEIIEKYNLECRSIFLRQCDQHGRNCAKACHRPMARRNSQNLSSRGGLSKRSSQQRATFKAKETPSSRLKKEKKNAIKEQKRWYEFTKLLKQRRQTRQRRDDNNEATKLKTSLPDCKEGIDVVYTWVNGSDPWHITEREKYIPSTAYQEEIDLGGKRWGPHGIAHMPAGDLSFRFRDFGKASTLKYSIRSILMYAPWIRYIWIVSAGRYGNAEDPQIPSWLNLNASTNKLRIVAHQEIFSKPERALPTFNSCAIETQLHHIKGLSECYLYLNDDFLLLKPLDSSHYVDKNGSLPFAVFSGGRTQRIGKDPWSKKVANIARILRRELKIPWEQQFLVGHHGHFFVKTVVKEVESLLKADFERTAAERWRTEESLWLPYMYSNYYAYSYAVRAKQETYHYHRLTDVGGVNGIELMFDSLINSTDIPQWLCVNDLLLNATQAIEESLMKGFENLFPDPSPFER